MVDILTSRKEPPCIGQSNSDDAPFLVSICKSTLGNEVVKTRKL